jgi:hypothetical protein
MAVGKTTAVRYLQENALRMKYLLPLKRKRFIGKENVDVLNVDNLNVDEVGTKVKEGSTSALNIIK